MNESMSENMMNIVRIEAARRRAGAKSYGQQVAENDYSHLKVKMKRRMSFDFTPNTVCEKCKRKFFKPERSQQRICDDCIQETRKKACETQKERLKKTRCTVCNKVLYRVNPENAVCKQCRERLTEVNAE